MVTQSQNNARPTWLSHDIFPFESRWISVSNHQIHYIDEGQGPTLLLLHGNGSWSFGFRYVIRALAAHFRVIALDYPGFGLSIAAPNSSLKPRDQSKVVETFVEALNLKDIRLFVEDWGGPIGLGFAGRHPNLIHSLIISNTWAWPAQGSPSLERFSHFAGSSIGYFLITRFNLLTRFAVINMSIARKLKAAEQQAYYLPYQTVESRIPQALLPREILASSLYLEEVKTNLGQLSDKPVQIIWGGGDPGFKEPEKKRFQEIFPSASTLSLPNAKHFVLVDEPEQSVQQILAFEGNGSNGSHEPFAML